MPINPYAIYLEYKYLDILISLYHKVLEVITLLVIQMDTFHYHRSKDIIYEAGTNKLCIFACININRAQKKGKLNRRTIIDGPSFLIETDVRSSDPDYLELPNADVFYELSKDKYDELLHTAKEDKKSFILYKD